MSTPVVALACVTEYMDDVPYTAVRRRYIDALEQAANCGVILISESVTHLTELLARVDGLVLGGHESNITASRYGASNGPGPLAPERDALAMAAIPLVLAMGKPFLGICRGLQELNVAMGGTLCDVVGHREDLSLPRDDQYHPAHKIHLPVDGVLRRILGRSKLRVNSLHGQAIDALGRGLRLEAYTEDGVIEAISLPSASAFCLAVQWHPEWYADSDDVSIAIFREFGRAVADHATRRWMKGPDEVFPRSGQPAR